MTNSFTDLETADVDPHHRLQHQRGAPHRAHCASSKAQRRGAKLIVIDPRAIDMARRADVHLQLLPGTNVAVLNGHHERDPRGGPRRTRSSSPSAPRGTRSCRDGARRVHAGAGGGDHRRARRQASARRRASSRTPTRGAIFYSMGITQHSHGTEQRASPSRTWRMLTGNIGRRGTGVNPLRGQNNVQGACDMGALPNVLHRLSGGRPIRAAQKQVRGGVGRRRSPTSPASRSRRSSTRMAAGKVSAPRTSWARTRCSPTPTRPTSSRRCKRPRLPRRAGHLPHRDGGARRRRAAGGELRREGRHLHQHRAQGAARARAVVPRPGEARADWAIIAELARPLGGAGDWDYASPARDHGRDRRALTPLVRRHHLRAPRGRAASAGRAPTRPSRARPSCTSGSSRAARASSSRSPTSPRRRSPDGDYPLTLTTGRMLEHYHTGTMTRRSDGLNELVPTGFVEIAPGRRGALGVSDGDRGQRGDRGAASSSVPARRHARACARARCSCRSTSGSRRPTCSRTRPATRWRRSPSSRSAPADRHLRDGRRGSRRRALIPLYDENPTRGVAVVTLVAHRGERRGVRLRAAAAARRPDAGRLLRRPGSSRTSSPTASTYRRPISCRGGRRSSRHVRPRRLAPPHLQHALPVDLRQQRRGRCSGGRGSSASTSLCGLVATAAAGDHRPRLDDAADRRQRRRRRRPRRLHRRLCRTPAC